MEKYKNLYKYATIESARKILENNSVAFSAPFEFNDVYDCDFYVSNSELNKCLDLQREFCLQQQWMKLQTTTDSQNAMFLSAVYKSLVSTQKKLMKRHHIYDPNPFLLWCSRKLRENGYGDGEVKSETIQQKLDEVKKHFFVSCFSERKDSLLMWAHYADKFKGVCIEWQLPNNELIKKVKYSKRKPQFQAYRLLKLVLGYHFLGEEVDLENHRIGDLVLRNVFVKSKDWDYEKEVRWVIDKDDLALPNIEYKEENNQAICRLKDAPICVYIGKRTSVEDENVIRELCKKYPNCKVIKTDISREEYRVLEIE